MSRLKWVVFSAFIVALLSSVPVSPAQVAVSIGVAPICPYGYFEYPPYDCAPYGFYGPDWFTGGVFIGAGPWFHGPHGWYGHVDNRYDPHHGYVGPLPPRGAQPFNHFQPNEGHDGAGHVGTPNHSSAPEHSAGYQGYHGGGGGASHGGGGGGHH